MFYVSILGFFFVWFDLGASGALGLLLTQCSGITPGGPKAPYVVLGIEIMLAMPKAGALVFVSCVISHCFLWISKKDLSS